jgi:acetyl esterase/lipase
MLLPGALGTADSDNPRVTIYLPQGRNTGTGVLVFPGGSYAFLAMDHEGRQIAEWLNYLGVAAFVVQYRYAPYHHPVELNDAKRAMRYVRSHAAEFKISPDRIGVWGFSAGGHLASTLGTHYDGGNPSSLDSIERVSSRPDFMILAYPVIDPLGLQADHASGCRPSSSELVRSRLLRPLLTGSCLADIVRLSSTPFRHHSCILANPIWCICLNSKL